jgi:clathrin heavy chain
VKEIRRIASYLYRKAKRFEKSIELSKADKQFKDCIETAAESAKSEIVESLLNFFVEKEEKEFFSVCTYTCYHLIKPDLILELAWRHNLMNFAMPFMI